MCEFDEDIIKARLCPYCGSCPDYIDSSKIYGKSYGMIYICHGCDAYVGTHKKNPIEPFGRLANKELRELKKEAHYYFDALWKKAIDNGRQKKEARTSAYKWLSEKLETPLKYTHIGMFDGDLCRKVINLCKPFHLKN